MSVDREAPDVSPALEQLGTAMTGASRGESPRLTGITNINKNDDHLLCFLFIGSKI